LDAKSFIISEITDTKNYKLLDATGAIVSGSFPRHKIKIVAKKQTSQSYEIEKILDHTLNNDRTEYLVKWKGYPDSVNSWIPKDNFDSMKIINKYHKNLKKVNLLQTKDINRDGQLQSFTTFKNPWHVLFMFYVLAILLGSASALNLYGKYNYCTSNGAKF
jgi:hypothetical protein